MKKVYLIIIVLAIFSCKEQQKSTDNKSNRLLENIKTIRAVKENPIKEISFAGRVMSNPDLTVSYSSLVNGVIERTYFSLGQYVSKGEVMLDIRSTELTTLESELITLETSLQVAERELKSAEDMFSDNMLSEKEYLESKGKVKQIKATYEKIKADISVYGKRKGFGVFSITAPVSGYVISKKGSVGGTVFSQAEPLFSIADLREVWVITNVYAGNLQFVSEGMEADVLSVAYPNEIFSGKINSIAQVFDPEDKTLKARIILDNKNLKLKPEMSVVVKLRNKSSQSLIALPSECVIFDNDSHFVIVRNENIFIIRKVSLYGDHAGKVYISEGVKEGEEIVAKNQLLLYSDLKNK